MAQALTPAQAKAYYDSFGSKQDWQAFYEDRAVSRLIAHGDFQTARAIFEFGCGTGRIAERLLRDELRRDCRYLGIDVSETMVGLASDRLARFGDRIQVRRSSGSSRLDADTGRFDRFLSTYVFDLLSFEMIHEVLQEAHRLLAPGGKLCLTGLTHGEGIVSQLLTGAWKGLWSLRPQLVGGCRPVDVSRLLAIADWEVEKREVLSAFGLCSEVLVARKRPTPLAASAAGSEKP